MNQVMLNVEMNPSSKPYLWEVVWHSQTLDNPIDPRGTAQQAAQPEI